MARKNIIGIYRITAKTNHSRFYIGSSVDIARRWRQHMFLLKNGEHHNHLLQLYVNKHGIESISFEIIELCKIDELITKEQNYYDKLRPYYNSKREVVNSNRGMMITEETRQKLRESHKGIYPTPETIKKRSQSLKGKKAWNKGIKSSVETRHKQSIALKNKTWEEIYGVEGARRRRIFRKKNNATTKPDQKIVYFNP